MSFKKILTKRVQKTGKLVPGARGNVNTAFDTAAKTVEATYHVPFLVHAPMEVPNATAWFQGDKIEVWGTSARSANSKKRIVTFL